MTLLSFWYLGFTYFYFSGSHLNATCIDHVTRMMTCVTQTLFNISIVEVKVEVIGMYT